MTSYAESFQGWRFIDVENARVPGLILHLMNAGAGFAHTCEPGGGCRRIYFLSDTSTRLIEEYFQQ